MVFSGEKQRLSQRLFLVGEPSKCSLPFIPMLLFLLYNLEMVTSPIDLPGEVGVNSTHLTGMPSGFRLKLC